MIPQKLDLMLQAGLSFISGANASFDRKVATTAGLTLGWQLSSPEAGTLYQGVELSALRIEETGDASTLDPGGLIGGLCSLFNATPDPTCSRGAAPAAYVFMLLYRIGGKN